MQNLCIELKLLSGGCISKTLSTTRAERWFF